MTAVASSAPFAFIRHRLARHRLVRVIGVRLLTGVVVLWGAATLAFLAMHGVKGDPALAALGPDANPTPEVLRQIRLEYGLDQPWYVQYLTYLGRLAHGDLGQSYVLRTSVATAIGQQIGQTVQLALSAAIIAVVLAVVVGTLTAKRGPVIRSATSGIALVFASMPSFAVGLALLVAFSFTLHWFPVSGNQGLASLVLPSFAMALPIAAVLTQILRASLEDVLEQPFILTARTRGMRDAAVRVRHGLRHALIPLVTMTGFVVGGLLGGAVITETLFVRQGIGRLLINAVQAKDVPIVLGVVLFAALVHVVVNLIVDIVYTAIDPRIETA